MDAATRGAVETVKVLVSGSAGFLGRHFMRALDGHDVLGLDIADGSDALEFLRSDDAARDLVIHGAAVAPHRTAIDGTPLSVGAGCLELDAAMFRWAERTRPGRVMYFSSSAA